MSVRLAVPCLFVLFHGSLNAEEIPWISEVITPPAEFPQASIRKSDISLPSGEDRAAALNEWKSERARIKAAWLKFLGPLPAAPASMSLKILQTEELEKCSRILVSYEVEPGRTVKAFLLRPKGANSSRYPGIVAFHSTTKETRNAVAGAGSKPEQAIGLRLAERGYVVLCPSNYLWEEKSYLAAVDAAKNRHPDSLGMATMLADGMRAVDILVNLPDVDPEKIGTIGHSLGAKEAFYLTAFDDRVKVGVSSEGGIGLFSTNWEAPWYLGPAIQEKKFPLGHDELVALIAPRPFLVLGGESGRGCSDGDRSWNELIVGQKVTKFYGSPNRIGLLNHHQGHRLSPEIAEKAFEWFDFYLKNGADD